MVKKNWVVIINDRSTKGKCYGFVTFTNPQSTIDAIKDMDGRTIEGRVVRVNGVKVGILSDSSSHHPIRCCPPLSCVEVLIYVRYTYKFRFVLLDVG
ncbi:cold-inducible RNA-binding protein B-like [Cucumis melo var. makuwa]|uniref:Cold-inducible RNA-binding protein B-like n=1 Tax=Cucumis melo var. makuwa TaxID=1194695 RepID=A0A5A7UC72_CUCMM|nr:cold-inducible RNA-binding protein B-like [Cucumis melo var. makuwa]